MHCIEVNRIMKKKPNQTNPEPKTEQINVRIERGISVKLRQIAEKEERTLSQLGRIAIREFVERKTSQEAAA
jgi:hypothetical protein